MDLHDSEPVVPLRKLRPWTFRVENIPANTSAQQLLEHFAEQDRAGIEVRSLAPAIVSTDGELTATITFLAQSGTSRREPQLLDPDGSMISIDEDFYGLTPLNAPQEPIIADIIAVTGLGGHAFGSWSCSPRYMWLRDFLPKDLPHVRVLTYGYNSQLKTASSRNILGDHVRMFKQRLITLPGSVTSPHRPIVFIGHSLGCLIIKKVLVELKASPSGNHVWDTPFVVFLGAPHRGLDNKALQTLVMPEFSKDIVDELGEQSSTLTDLNENFAKIAHDLQILSCYELRPTPTVVPSSDGTWKRDGPSAMMVSQNSAMLHSAHELRVPCDADHTHIAKLKRTEAGLYHIIKGHIQQALERFQAPDLIPQRPVSRRRDMESSLSPGGQNKMPGALPAERLELAGQVPTRPLTLRVPTTSSTKKTREPRAPSVQEQHEYEQHEYKQQTHEQQTHEQQTNEQHVHGQQTHEQPVREQHVHGQHEHEQPVREQHMHGQHEHEQHVRERRTPKRNTSASEKEVWFQKDPSPSAESESQQPFFISEASQQHSPLGISPRTSVVTSISEAPEQHSPLSVGPRASLVTSMSEAPGQHSPLGVGARASLVPSMSEALTDPRPTTPNTGIPRPQSYHDRQAKVSSQYEEEFLDGVWDAQSDGSKFVVVPTSPRDPSPQHPEYHPPVPGPSDSNTKNEAVTPTSTRRLSKDIFSIFKHKNPKPDPSQFLAAARENNVSKMKELLEAGAELESKTSQNDNRTALHEAASLGYTEVANFLIGKGAKKDAKTKSKLTPLHEAAFAGSTEVARLLIRAGAQMEARNYDDSTPLQLAAIRGHRDVAQVLVNHGANVHTQRVAGITPLEDARTNGHKEVAQLLVRAGAALRSRRSHLEDEQENQWPGLF